MLWSSENSVRDEAFAPRLSTSWGNQFSANPFCCGAWANGCVWLCANPTEATIRSASKINDSLTRTPQDAEIEPFVRRTKRAISLTQVGEIGCGNEDILNRIIPWSSPAAVEEEEPERRNHVRI